MKLHQVLALQEGLKTRYFNDMKKLDQDVRRKADYEGLERAYTPFDDNDVDKLPSESKRVAFRLEDQLHSISPRFNELVDSIATHETANQQACADLKVNDVVIYQKAPVTLLLFLEKKLVEFRQLIEAMPLLDPGEEWGYDEGARLFRSNAIEKARTRKEKVALVKIPPTPQHPGQAETYDRDVRVGTWKEQKLSGAISEERKRNMLDRCETLLKVVKAAREEANDQTVTPVKGLGEDLFNLVFGK